MPPFIAPLRRILNPNNDYSSYDEQQHGGANTSKLALRVADVVRRTWDLGFTAFGGPPVHFQILWRRFVLKGEGGGDGERGLAVGGKAAWVDEQTVSFFLLDGCTTLLAETCARGSDLPASNWLYGEEVAANDF